jgi:hypothetical protein
VRPAIAQLEGELDRRISLLLLVQTKADAMAGLGGSLPFARRRGAGEERFDPLQLLD